MLTGQKLKLLNDFQHLKNEGQDRGKQNRYYLFAGWKVCSCLKFLK